MSRTTYSTLFGFIGTTYGSGDGTTTFNVPDLRGRLTYGKDDMGGVAAARLTTAFFGADPTVLGNGGGSQSKALIASNLPAYTPSGTIAVTNGAITPSTNGFITNTPFQGQGITGSSAVGTSNGVTVTFNQAASSAVFTGTAQGGTSVAFALINPGMIMNKIIFAGT